MSRDVCIIELHHTQRHLTHSLRWELHVQVVVNGPDLNVVNDCVWPEAYTVVSVVLVLLYVDT